MLIVNNVTKKYCSVTALENVSFMVQPKEIVGLVGANGAGKTTAIKLLTNILEADSGEIILDGTNIDDLCDYRIDKIAYIPDDPISRRSNIL